MNTRPPCPVCDDTTRSFAWTDLHGEATCRCGTPFQILRNGAWLDEPTVNIRDEAIPILRRYWSETGQRNGLGTYLGFDDYPGVLDARRAFNAWFEAQYPNGFPEPEPQATID